MAAPSQSLLEQAYLKAYRAAQAADARFSAALERAYKGQAGTVRYQPAKQSPAIRALGSAYQKTAEAMGKALEAMRKVGGSIAHMNPRGKVKSKPMSPQKKAKRRAIKAHRAKTNPAYADYSEASREARKKANDSGMDVAIRKVKEFGKTLYRVSYASKNDSDYATAEIVQPDRKKGNPSKLERCVRDVTRKGGAAKPWAVCKAALKNPRGFSVVQGKASADVSPSGSAWVVRIKGDKPKEFKSVEAAAKYARLRVHETAPAQNAKRANGKRSLISKLVHSRKLSNPRGNPEESAVQMYHVFHGKPATQVLEFVQREHVHEWLWAAGTLVSITVANGNQQMTLCSADPDEDEPEDVVMVGFSEDGRQAYFVGGDQDIDLDRLMEEFSMTEDDIRDHMKIGQVRKLTYRTSKNFEEGGKVDIDFYHKLGGEHSKGVMPDLIFKPLNPSMELVGGRYFVAPKDGQLGASPGVVG